MESVAAKNSVAAATKEFKELQELVATFREGVDFGAPTAGNPKKELRQPGAQRLLDYYNLTLKLPPVTDQIVADWKAPFFHYVYRAEIYNQEGRLLVSVDGSANSKEEMFALIWLPEGKVPRGINTADLPTKNFEGPDGRSFPVYGVPNPDPFGLPNQLMRVSQKRAMIAATVIATKSSGIFTPESETGKEPRAGRKKAGDQRATVSPKQIKMLDLRLEKSKVSPAAFEAFLAKNFPYTVKDAQPRAALILAADLDFILRWIKDRK